MIEVEAVLCEDGRSVALYYYDGDELLHFTSKALPVAITETSFEDMRREWQEAFTPKPCGPS